MKKFDDINRLMGAKRNEQEFMNKVFKAAIFFALRNEDGPTVNELVSDFLQARQEDYIRRKYLIDERENTCVKKLTETNIDDEGNVKSFHVTWVLANRDDIKDETADHIYC